MYRILNYHVHIHVNRIQNEPPLNIDAWSLLALNICATFARSGLRVSRCAHCGLAKVQGVDVHIVSLR